ncbi:hypothetical protein PO909_011320 [Leuciscus waleckii]
MPKVTRQLCDFAIQFESLLETGKKQLAATQKADPSLVKCLTVAVQKDEVADKDVAYVWEDGVLIRKRSELEVFQVVVPRSLDFVLSS